MSKRFYPIAALFLGAAFVISPAALSQVPVVDGVPVASPSAPPASAPTTGAAQGELFYQLQLVQQEVMQLRGLVEEQAHMINQLKKQSMERYIDLDRRVASLSTQAPVAAGNTSQSAVVAIPVSGTATSAEKAAYNSAYALVTSKRFESALEAFKQFVVDYPDGHYTPNALYWMGELYQVVKPKNLEAARQAFTQLLERYPDNSKAADAMYKLGKVYYQKGDREKSRQWLNRVIAENGSSKVADKARKFLRDNF